MYLYLYKCIQSMSDCHQNYTPYRREHNLSAECNGFHLISNSHHFVELVGSLPPLQMPATFPYSEPHQSSPCLPSYFQEIHPNIKLPFKRGSSKWSFSIRFLHQSTVCTSPLPHTCCMPAQLNLLDFITRKLLS